MRPRSSGRVRSSWAVCVIDHVRPWFTPSNTVAATTQPQLGAIPIIHGMGRASHQPHSSTARLPYRSERRPAKKFIPALTSPKASTNELSSKKEPWGTPKSASAMTGITVRVMPRVSPT